MSAPHIFPAPRKSNFAKTMYDLTDHRWIRIDPAFSDSLKSQFADLAELASPLFSSAVQVCAGSPQHGEVLLEATLAPKDLPPQGYRLEGRAGGIVLRGADEAGVFYGLQTLQQILQQYGSVLPRFTIADHPDFPQRGVMLDVSRCKVPTMETLFDLVDLLAAFKINQIQLYMEHTFAFSAHEPVWHDSSPITAEEIMELDSYCRERYVQLVPNLNSFGHFERWLVHPEYTHLSECPDGVTTSWGHTFPHGSTLRPTKESLTFLAGLYDEFLPNFTSTLFNVGCDETWELGQGWSKPKCDKTGTTRVYLDFVKKIYGEVKKRDRTMMFWGDIILHDPALIKELPGDLVALEWGYEYDHDFLRHGSYFARSGVPFYVCPGTSSWNALTGRTDNALGNCANAAVNGLRHGAVGYLNTDWGDGGHHQYLPISYVGYLAGAAYSWCYRSNKDADIAAALDDFVFGEPGGGMGRILYELGNVYTLIGKRSRNKTHFNALLFGDPQRDTNMLKGISKRELGKCMARFDRLESELLDTDPDIDDADLVKDEVRNAIAMARLGTTKALRAKGENIDPAELRHALQHIVSEHERLWLSRNRPGGLRESSGRLRGALEMDD